MTQEIKVREEEDKQEERKAIREDPEILVPNDIT